jgi:hypothetical protein
MKQLLTDGLKRLRDNQPSNLQSISFFSSSEFTLAGLFLPPFMPLLSNYKEQKNQFGQIFLPIISTHAPGEKEGATAFSTMTL